jgi:hypothetical protein
MRIIDLNASKWGNPIGIYDAIKAALGSCEGHGSSPDALIDSIIWGGMNRIEPPYIIRFIGASSAPKEVRDYIRLIIDVIREARDWRRMHEGTDIDATLIDADFSH